MGDTICDKGFWESLPPNCPPADAADVAYSSVYRFLPSNPPSGNDFASHAAQGSPPPGGVDACRWASCSFFLTKGAAMKRLPKIRKRFKFVTRLRIPKGAGLSKEARGHIDFWFFKTFDPLSAVIETESI